MLSTSVEIRVRYEETDQMGVVYHGKYFTWFEVARVHLLDRIGFPYSELERKGFLLPVLNCAAKFRAPALFDDRLKVEARITDIPVARISLDYRVSRKDVLLAEGGTTHAFVSKEGKLVRPPKGFLRGVELFMHGQTSSKSSEELT
tara:strand:+ start:646 stop:1083 length:438 start_codon:yes stop_codon:yes gene_type:complete